MTCKKVSLKIHAAKKRGLQVRGGGSLKTIQKTKNPKENDQDQNQKKGRTGRTKTRTRGGCEDLDTLSR
eukprot:688812-Karenia_brevis.AAC.1